MIPDCLEIIRKKIQKSCQRVGRSSHEIMLVAATKGVSAPEILEAFHEGIQWFGENRVQEALGKIPQLPSDLKWHMMGHLQTNKADDAIRLFEMIQSVDSFKLAERLQKVAAQKVKVADILLEINIGREETKFGFLEEEVESAVQKIQDFSNLRVRGFMTVAPFFEDAEEGRPYFKKMKMLLNHYKNLDILSMGMSHDYPVAIEEGSTMIRIGQAIFGPRERPR
ncbi:MAG: YggS family pyridoxal phosphate-dependent enzyme [Chlamydiae bacterium]|nr:YggS family pyridoxal phosphate-dependent enzyme [Chlamydiota bacterium]MBI3266125.1 YggS family pyridoxal phosphate-dependent enzyme [Chlamydiota bacterium]